MTVEQLRKLLSGLGYWLPSRSTKQDLLDRARKHLEWNKNFKFFDGLAPRTITIIGRHLEPRALVLLMRCSKRLNEILQSNFIWRYYAMKLDPYMDIHPADLQRTQPDGFWKHWWIDNNTFSVALCKPLLVDYKGRTLKKTILMPQIGSLLRRGGHHAAFLAPGNTPTQWVCIRIDFHPRGQNEGLPKEFYVTPAEISEDGRTCNYTLQRRECVKIRESGNFSLPFTLISSEEYAF